MLAKLKRVAGRLMARPLVRLGIRVRARARQRWRWPRCCRSCAAGAEETSPRGRGRVRDLRAAPASCPRRPSIRALAGDALAGLEIPTVAAGLGAALARTTCSPSQVGRPRRAPAVDPRRGRGRPRRSTRAQLFGAGTHPTTQLCLELLLGVRAAGGRCATGAPARACSRSPPRAWASRRSRRSSSMPDGLEAIRDQRRGQRRRRCARAWSNLAATAPPVGADRHAPTSPAADLLLAARLRPPAGAADRLRLAARARGRGRRSRSRARAARRSGRGGEWAARRAGTA